MGCRTRSACYTWASLSCCRCCDGFGVRCFYSRYRCFFLHCCRSWASSFSFVRKKEPPFHTKALYKAQVCGQTGCPKDQRLSALSVRPHSTGSLMIITMILVTLLLRDRFVYVGCVNMCVRLRVYVCLSVSSCSTVSAADQLPAKQTNRRKARAFEYGQCDLLTRMA